MMFMFVCFIGILQAMQLNVKLHTCLYYLAGYNNVDVSEFLLENGADVNAQDKGGLIPLHNASSYGVSRISVAVKC